MNGCPLRFVLFSIWNCASSLQPFGWRASRSGVYVRSWGSLAPRILSLVPVALALRQPLTTLLFLPLISSRSSLVFAAADATSSQRRQNSQQQFSNSRSQFDCQSRSSSKSPAKWSRRIRRISGAFRLWRLGRDRNRQIQPPYRAHTRAFV